MIQLKGAHGMGGYSNAPSGYTPPDRPIKVAKAAPHYPDQVWLFETSSFYAENLQYKEICKIRNFNLVFVIKVETALIVTI